MRRLCTLLWGLDCSLRSTKKPCANICVYVEASLSYESGHDSRSYKHPTWRSLSFYKHRAFYCYIETILSSLGALSCCIKLFVSLFYHAFLCHHPDLKVEGNHTSSQNYRLTAITACIKGQLCAADHEIVGPSLARSLQLIPASLLWTCRHSFPWCTNPRSTNPNRFRPQSRYF